ncbi:MAG TPA: FliH/SctL family protein [Candidatus Binatia bacterium]|nr:FliH/SctL family protein [Candidatus Binatia bacterium]
MSSFETTSRFQPLCAALPPGDDGFGPLAVERRAADGDPPRPGIFPDLAARRSAAPPSGAAEPPADPAVVARAAELVEAYERGVADGRAGAEAGLRDRVAAVADAIAEIERFRAALRDRVQGEILDLALHVARRILEREVEVDRDQWLELIRAGVHKSLDRERIRVRAGSELHAFLASRSAELRARLEEVKELEIVEDPSFAPDACVVETSMGDVELAIDSQIATLKSELEEPA